jgi:rod shape determining protein RodA
LLLSIGILVIASSSIALSVQQTIFAVLGFLAYFVIAQLDYRTLTNLIKPSYFLIILLLIIVFILGIETRGSMRWIPLGPLNIQPSEFAKPMMVLFLAFYWSARSVTWIEIFKSLLWTLPILGLIYKQPDLGTTLTIGVIWLGALLGAGISFKKVLVILAIVALMIPLSLTHLADYQKQRITTFLSPYEDPLGQGYNIIQSTIAVGSGQIVGRGLGQGTQSRLQFLPEFRTDFIFASVAEELGFLGSLTIVLIYLFLISYCLKVASKSVDFFGFLICFCSASILLFQTAVNIGMNVGIVPITGVTLPLISYGGSSLIATLISLGLVASVARIRRPVDVKSVGGYN